MTMRATSYFEAAMDLLKWEKEISQKKLKLSPKTFYWKYDTRFLLTRNAVFYHAKNVLEIPGPELIFENTFNSKVPLYVAYGGVGTTVGHELIHPLVRKGLKYNENGDWTQWVSEKTMKNFTDRAKCIIEQYSSIKEPITQLHVNGDNTQDETISDNSGLKVAYHAYRRAANITGTEPGLPHLEHYTPDQLFFITAANYFCEIPNKRVLEYTIMNDVHPPNEVRVNGMMMNSRAFSEAFNCDKGDKMNPSKKCEVW